MNVLNRLMQHTALRLLLAGAVADSAGNAQSPETIQVTANANFSEVNQLLVVVGSAPVLVCDIISAPVSGTARVLTRAPRLLG